MRERSVSPRFRVETAGEGESSAERIENVKAGAAAAWRDLVIQADNVVHYVREMLDADVFWGAIAPGQGYIHRLDGTEDGDGGNVKVCP